jgi:3',5'-cyclic AMP phosphodiesterase CpdA
MTYSGIGLVGLVVFAAGLGCGGEQALLLPADASGDGGLDGLTLVARIAHITDTHLVDEQSPARFAKAHVFTGSAWRPYEAYSAQLLDGIIRTVNRIHASGRKIDFLLHTGDACDNVQSNELAWFIAVMEGGAVDPLSGPDDRAAQDRPDPTRDPHASFIAQGLYRTGTHGELPSVPWYIVPGNHDRYAVGVLPIVQWSDGSRTAPLPLERRPGLWLPLQLDPLSCFAYGRVTPADPGPPGLLDTPRYVEPNQTRAYFDEVEFVEALMMTATEPVGHGFVGLTGGTPRVQRSSPAYYSLSPVAGVRLIGLDTTDLADVSPGGFYEEGTLSRVQLAFLRNELEAALEREEIVIVASHHPSPSLLPSRGSEVAGDEFRTLLNAYPNVALHLAGHKHRNRVTNWGGYLEIESCSTLDLPQEGRLIEIWRDDVGCKLVISYEMFSHLDESLPALGDDPLRELRQDAWDIARGDKSASARLKRFDASGAAPSGDPDDRRSVVYLK